MKTAKGSNKTILVGIDFTKSSENALNYAIMMAKKINASVMLYHVYETPVVHTFSGAYFISYTEMRNYNIERLQRYKAKIKEKHPHVDFEVFATYKTFRNGVKELLSRKKIHYVILGLESKSKFTKFIYGTTGLEVAGKIECPVIIVPEKYVKHKLHKAVLAMDNQQSVHSKVMKKVQEFNKLFKMEKEIIHIKTDNEFMIVNEKKANKINKKWRVKVVEARTFEEGILDYVKKQNTDLLSVLSHSHSALYDLFKETNTKALAFSTRIPIMSVHH